MQTQNHATHKTNTHSHSAPSHTTGLTLPPDTTGAFVDTVAWSLTHTPHHICSSPVYLGMNKGPQCQNDKLWLLIVDELTQHNNSQKHHSMPSHTPPMLYTPSIGVAPPNIPQHHHPYDTHIHVGVYAHIDTQLAPIPQACHRHPAP